MLFMIILKPPRDTRPLAQNTQLNPPELIQRNHYRTTAIPRNNLFWFFTSLHEGRFWLPFSFHSVCPSRFQYPSPNTLTNSPENYFITARPFFTSLTQPALHSCLNNHRTPTVEGRTWQTPRTTRPKFHPEHVCGSKNVGLPKSSWTSWRVWTHKK